MAYSLPQPPRHSWLPENQRSWNKWSMSKKSKLFHLSAKILLLKLAILSKCDCWRQFQPICTGFSPGWKNVSGIWTETWKSGNGTIRVQVKDQNWTTFCIFFSFSRFAQDFLSAKKMFLEYGRRHERAAMERYVFKWRTKTKTNFCIYFSFSWFAQDFHLSERVCLEYGPRHERSMCNW